MRLHSVVPESTIEDGLELLSIYPGKRIARSILHPNELTAEVFWSTHPSRIDASGGATQSQGGVYGGRQRRGPNLYFYGTV